ncbi:MAG: hypothetical protein HY664_08105 [Chloroflexi bacterium]|nr:hypothetical protein [Chloroflexota bacterium]
MMHIRFSVKTVVILSLALVILGSVSILASRKYFGTPRKQSELYGTYVADYKIAKEKLILKDDGTFEQEVTIKKTGGVSVTKGSWTYDPKDGYVTFHYFIVVLDGFGEFDPGYAQPKRGAVIQDAVKLFGRIRLEVGDFYSYKKVGSDMGP